MSWPKFSMKPGTRVTYTFGKKRLIGRFIHVNGGYFWFMAGPGKFSISANHVIQLYENEFELLTT